MCNLMMYETIAISFYSFGLAQQVFIFSKSHKLYIFYDLANLHIVWKILKMYHFKKCKRSLFLNMFEFSCQKSIKFALFWRENSNIWQFC